MGSNDAETLSGMEIDAIGEILNISLGSSATSVSELLGQPVKITTPKVRVMKTDDFDIKTYEPAIGVEINYVKGLDGQNILILKESDVKIIVGLLLQTDFSDREFVMDEMNIGAICEVMNQMMGASATALSQFLSRSISISPPNSFSIGNSEQFKTKYFGKEEDIVAVYFNLMIGKLVNSQFINVMRIGLARDLISNFGLGDVPASAAPKVSAPAPAAPAPAAPVAPKVSAPAPAAPAPAAPVAPAVSAPAPAAPAPAAPVAPAVSAPASAAPVPTAPVAPAVSAPAQAAPVPAAPAAPAVSAPAPAAPVPTAPAAPAVSAPAPAAPVPTAPAAPAVSAPAPAAPVPTAPAAPAAATLPYAPVSGAPDGGYRVNGAVYPSFDARRTKLNQGESNNLGMIMSVPLQITVEIGRTSKKIKEILDFTSGTIVELNRPAGSQVDVYVNGKAIAKGDVVVVDDNYGVRITEILNNNEIMKLL